MQMYRIIFNIPRYLLVVLFYGISLVCYSDNSYAGLMPDITCSALIYSRALMEDTTFADQPS